MEYVCGAMSGTAACVFTNPLDVVKTRLQLQGELQARGQHVVHYRNTLHAFYTIARNDGILALQKGRFLGHARVHVVCVMLFEVCAVAPCVKKLTKKNANAIAICDGTTERKVHSTNYLPTTMTA